MVSHWVFRRRKLRTSDVAYGMGLMTLEERLAEISQRLEKATPGPLDRLASEVEGEK